MTLDALKGLSRVEIQEAVHKASEEELCAFAESIGLGMQVAVFQAGTEYLRQEGNRDAKRVWENHARSCRSPSELEVGFEAESSVLTSCSTKMTRLRYDFNSKMVEYITTLQPINK